MNCGPHCDHNQGRSCLCSFWATRRALGLRQEEGGEQVDTGNSGYWLIWALCLVAFLIFTLMVVAAMEPPLY